MPWSQKRRKKKTSTPHLGNLASCFPPATESGESPADAPGGEWFSRPRTARLSVRIMISGSVGRTLTERPWLARGSLTLRSFVKITGLAVALPNHPVLSDSDLCVPELRR